MTHKYQEMHPAQVRNVLKFIDGSQSETIKESIFSQLGYECFYARNLDEWIGKYKEDVRVFRFC